MLNHKEASIILETFNPLMSEYQNMITHVILCYR